MLAHEGLTHEGLLSLRIRPPTPPPMATGLHAGTACPSPSPPLPFQGAINALKLAQMTSNEQNIATDRRYDHLEARELRFT